MTLLVNLDAIAANASKALALAHAAGWTISAVVKDAYACAPVVAAMRDGGVKHFSVSSLRGAKHVVHAFAPPAAVTLITLPLPSRGEDIIASCAASVHSSAGSLQAFARMSASSNQRHDIFIALRTGEDREGINPEDLDLLSALVAAARADTLRTAGVLANFGCRIESRPKQKELDAIFHTAKMLSAMTGEPVELNLGGSVLLPAPPRMDWDGPKTLRIGEAIFAGAIPGGAMDGAFTKPFVLETHVLEVDKRGDSQRLILDCGTATIDPIDATLDHPARFFHLSGEHSSVDVDGADPFRVGDSVRLTLGYKSAIRAMLNASTEIRWRRRAA